MHETDMWLMTALTFIPALFALLIAFIPGGAKELIRWLSLIGTALALAINLVLFVGFYDMIGSKSERDVMPMHAKSSLLEQRVDADAERRPVVETPDGRAKGMQPPDSRDYVSRAPWISRFNIEYFLGIDGISMPLLLLSTVLFFLSM